MAVTVLQMSIADRISVVLERSKQCLGPAAGQLIDELRTPTNLSIMAGTLVVWGASHLVGIGEIVDVLLLAVGVFTIGWSIGDLAKDLATVAHLTVNGTSEDDLNVAAAALGRAIVVAGATTIMALLLRRSVKQIQATRGTTVADAMRLRNPGLPNVGADPAKGRIWSKPGIKSDPTLPAGEGSTSAFGEVILSSAGTASEQALVRAHELVHQLLTPRFIVLRTFRVRLSMSGYLRSMLLKYFEEAMAETVAQLAVYGPRGLLRGIRFPIENGYVTIGSLMTEGAVIGKIAVGSQFFAVQFIPSGVESMCY